ncbi:MAG: hypothetical protein IT430_07190 [Phycisphaerales bacterium]|nr:hypothetical protein [Phycisphaerales bacterium]
MGVDYREQYEPDQLEPFWPNEIIKMTVSVLVCLAIIMFLVTLPVLLDMLGVHGMVHEEQPANPRGSTPVGIKPEWYFLAVYQYLRVWPTTLLGLSGKTWGVLSQGPVILVIVLLPFWYRGQRARTRPKWFYRIAVTTVAALAIIFTFWGGWPERMTAEGEQLAPLSEYFGHRPLFFIFTAIAIIVFYALVAHERRAIRRVLYREGQPETEPPFAGLKHHGLLLMAGLGAIALHASRAQAASPPEASPPPAEQHAADPYAQSNCVQCHMNLPGRSSEIVELEWKHSVHYAANVGCDGCHGGNAALRRDQFESDDAFKRAAHLERQADFLVTYLNESEFVSQTRGRAVSYFCGKCHADIKEKHLGSPHGDFGDPTCLYCHGQGSHKITQPSPEIIDTRSRAEGGRCSPCHRAATMESVKRIKEILIETEAQVAKSTDLSGDLTTWGYRNLSLEQAQQNAAEVNSRLRQVFHSFNMRDINNFAAEIGDGVDRIQATHELIERLREQQRQQTKVGSAAVVLLLAFSGLLVYYKSSFLDREHTA